MKKTILAILLATLMIGSVLTGCGEKQQTASDDERVTISVAYPKADETWTQDDYYKYITDKVNIDIEFQALSSDSAAEKARIMISSGSMTDIVYTSSFMLDEYASYAKQGLVKGLPDDWKEKYPNLGFALEMTGVLDSLEDAGDGSVYALLRPMDHYTNYIDEFRAAYKEGKDLRELMSEQKYLYIDRYGFAYRKDWAEKLGIKTQPIMEYDDFIDMVLKFKEADLGGVGADNTVGIAVDHTEAPNIFVTAFNSSYKYFNKDGKDKYVCGLLEDSTTEGVKAYVEAYRSGVLSPGFYTQKTQNLNSLFCSQRSGVIFPRAEVSALRTLNTEFEKANPGLKASECIDVCWIKSPDGKIHGREASNYWGVYYLNPDMSDEKLDRIMALADYISSEEGGPQIRLGLEGVDYKKENGKYVNIRPKDENGSIESLDKKYPSNEFFRLFLNPLYMNEVTETDPYARERMDTLVEEKLKNDIAVLSWDAERDAYVADDYVKFNAAYDVNSMFAEIVVADGDPEENWLKKRAEFEDAAKSVADKMNKELLGK